MPDALVGIGKAVVGFGTGAFLFFLLPMCFLGFDWLTRYRFIDKSRRFREWAMLGLAGLSFTVAWLLWRYVLPDWWIAATPLLSYDD